MKISILRVLFICISCLPLNGCIICDNYFLYDYGNKKSKEHYFTRYGDIQENYFVIGIQLYSSEIQINILTKFNAPFLVKDSVSHVKFVKIYPTTSSGLVLVKMKRYNQHFKIYDEYYTCENFSSLVKKNKHLKLKIVFDLDSLGKVTRHEKEYKLVRRKQCHIGVH